MGHAARARPESPRARPEWPAPRRSAQSERPRFPKTRAARTKGSRAARLKKEEVPAGVLDKEKEIYASQIKDKPPHVIEKIAEGKLEKFYTDNCLMEQIFIKDPEQKKKVKDLVTERIARVGENIVVKRFVRFQLGEGKKN